ncbi:DUF1150 family protein [Paracoccus sp. (in: a-proteobacteria)]|uniref:DUF1150 family protein n=1 Tax=Paracoccus sp. TaxID=267 RepID=UPI0026E09602|nr:DUF1150 family protein [Paracoccus sp. (in: a-proteobacteria)]MDO5647275.1 DUF1150 family protein [Paracoccus sp. (in: a-proteobacteria)]
METKFNFADPPGLPTVYVRKVAAKTLPQDLRDQLDGVETLYAVHDTDGERLALVLDRQMAFMLARQNELAPVSVH